MWMRPKGQKEERGGTTFAERRKEQQEQKFRRGVPRRGKGVQDSHKGRLVLFNHGQKQSERRPFFFSLFFSLPFSSTFLPLPDPLFFSLSPLHVYLGSIPETGKDWRRHLWSRLQSHVTNQPADLFLSLQLTPLLVRLGFHLHSRSLPLPTNNSNSLFFFSVRELQEGLSR